MSEIQKKPEEAMGLMYIKYFNRMLRFVDTYHRTQDGLVARYVIVDPQNVNQQDLLEKTIRESLGFDKESNELDYNQINKIRSVLANLTKINGQKLKQAVLMTFREYTGSRTQSSLQIERLNMLRSVVANAALVNGLATSFDYFHLITVDKKSQYLNDLIAQAKSDIKSEMAQIVPDYKEIYNLCWMVLSAAKFVNMPEETMKMLGQEFNEDAIIAGGDYVSKFEKTVELERAEQDILMAKSSNFDVVSKENETLKQENLRLKNLVKNMSNMAAGMRASLLSRGVNKYKKMIAKISVANQSNIVR